MKLGLYSDGLGHLPLEACLDFCHERSLECIELGTGNWSQAPHVDLASLLASSSRRDELLGAIAEHGLTISALNCSGNPLHPGAAGEAHRKVIADSIVLASQMGIGRIVTMSGCPGGPGDNHVNWIVTSWPPETGEILTWQWREQVIPYWVELAAMARDHGVRLCLEMHGVQCVYNVETFERLRAETGDGVGINFDPSHLLWMGADPIAAAERLGSNIFHAHAKDARLEGAAAINSRLDAKPVMPVEGRSWNFVAVGRGQDASFWRALVETLRGAGYEDVLSIENEDYALAAADAIDASIACLRGALAP